MIDFGLRRVDILGELFVLCTEYAPSKSYDFSRKCMYGKHYTPPKAVAQTPIICFVTKPGLDKVFLFESFAYSLLYQCVMTLGTETKLKFFNDIIPESTLAEVSHTDASPIYMVFQYILEIVAGEVINDKHTFACTLRLLLFIGQFPFFYFDVILLSQVF